MDIEVDQDVVVAPEPPLVQPDDKPSREYGFVPPPPKELVPVPKPPPPSSMQQTESEPTHRQYEIWCRDLLSTCLLLCPPVATRVAKEVCCISTECLPHLRRKPEFLGYRIRKVLETFARQDRDWQECFRSLQSQEYIDCQRHLAELAVGNYDFTPRSGIFAKHANFGITEGDRKRALVSCSTALG